MTVEEKDNFEPEEEMRPRTTGLYCFFNAERVCGPECMAYVTFPKAAQAPELGEQQLHCILLSSVERLGRSAVALASMQANAIKQSKVADADRRRQEQFQPTNPLQSPFGKDRE